MKNSRKIPILSILLFMLFANAVAFAVTEYVSNGIWRYGPSAGLGYSDYFHSSYAHHSSVINPNNGAKGWDDEWSNAKHIKIPPNDLEYYYGLD